MNQSCLHTLCGLLERRTTHPDVATAANNIGELLKLLGRFSEAAGHYHDALEVWLDRLGDAHPHVAVALLNLGQLMENVGKVLCKRIPFLCSSGIY